MSGAGNRRRPLVLGIDLGTSAVKVLAVDAERGRPLAAASAPYGTRSDGAGRAEQDPVDWWRAAADAVPRVLASRHVGDALPVAVGISGQMHGLVVTDATGAALLPCQTWADVRGTAEAAEIEASLGGRRRAVAIAGSAPDPSFTAAKALWLRRHEPEVLDRARWLMLPKDWLRLLMTGEAATEPSDASGTGLCDVERRAWSSELCAAAGVEPATLPPLVGSADVAGHLTPGSAEALRLPAGTPVAAGAGDALAAAVAAPLETGPRRNALASLGTAGQILVRLSRPIVEPDGRLHALCHPEPDTWVLMAAILSAGSALRWLADTLIRPGAPVTALLREAAAVPAGADGLVFAPWLRGERSPHLDPDVRGAFVGLTLAHGRGHLARAVLEGVCYALREGVEAMARLGVRPESLLATGGGARNPLWRAMLADVLGVRVARLPTDDVSALGAARLAARAVGQPVETWSIGTTDVREPDSDNASLHHATYARYTRLYGSLRDLRARRNSARPRHRLLHNGRLR